MEGALRLLLSSGSAPAAPQGTKPVTPQGHPLLSNVATSGVELLLSGAFCVCKLSTKKGKTAERIFLGSPLHSYEEKVFLIFKYVTDTYNSLYISKIKAHVF